jgi:flagellar protein FlbD
LIAFAATQKLIEMIQVTRLNGTRFFVNAELIEFVEGTPDTIISLSNGIKIIVKESPQAVVEAIVSYRRDVYGQLPEIAYRGGN